MLSQIAHKKCLVTGGAGFIGSNLCNTLVELGCDVVCLDNLSTGRMSNISHLLPHPQFRFIYHDILEPLQALALDLDSPDYVFHLACPASPPKYQLDPIKTLRICFEGTRNILEYVRSNPKTRFIFSSTSEVYGDPDCSPQKETYQGNVNCIGPRACYDEGKRIAETLVVSYGQQHAVDYGIVRIFNTYGPNMSDDDGRVITNFRKQAREGQALTIYGDGTQTRSFCYITDLVSGLILMSLSEEQGPINLGNPEEITIRTLAEHIGGDIVYMPAQVDDPQCRCPDISQATEKLGWRPTVMIKEGLVLMLGGVCY